MKVYDVPLYSPINVHGEAEQPWPPSAQLTEYPLIGPPSELGAVQVGVRISNRKDTVLARLQDMEFVTYTDVFQNARDRLAPSYVPVKISDW